MKKIIKPVQHHLTHQTISLLPYLLLMHHLWWVCQWYPPALQLVRNSASPSSKEISSSLDELSLSPTLSQSTPSISPIVYESFTISPSDVTWSDSYTGTVHGSASPSSKEPSFSPYGLLSSPPTILHTIPSEDPDFLRSIPFSDLIITISFSTTHRILMLDDIKDEPLLI